MLKGELFSPDMVRAYLDGRKLHTARPVKAIIPCNAKYHGLSWDEAHKNVFGVFRCEDGFDIDVKPAFFPRDFMYCRETWCIQSGHRFEMDVKIRFKSGGPMTKIQFPNRIAYDEFLQKWDKTGKDGDSRIWIPSIHMPREAARLFFRVTKVEAMLLEAVTEQFAREDGFTETTGIVALGGRKTRLPKTALDNFRQFWLDTYGPDARWMWVYWSALCSKETAHE